YREQENERASPGRKVIQHQEFSAVRRIGGGARPTGSKARKQSGRRLGHQDRRSTRSDFAGNRVQQSRGSVGTAELGQSDSDGIRRLREHLEKISPARPEPLRFADR